MRSSSSSQHQPGGSHVESLQGGSTVCGTDRQQADDEVNGAGHTAAVAHTHTHTHTPLLSHCSCATGQDFPQDPFKVNCLVST